MKIIAFDTLKKERWFKKISHAIAESRLAFGKDITLDFTTELKKEDLMPYHIVSYACLIQWLSDHNCKVAQGQTNKEIAQYIYHELGLKKYWCGSNHEETEEYNVFNLWRIVESEKDLYSKRVEDYFKRTYFCDKDLSPISLSLVEAFYNIFDHAQSGNNAFVHMSYNPTDMVLYIAVADMGLGIVNTVKKYSPTIINDVDALREAIKDNFTISSTTHNRGKGLDNILSCANNLQILSGSALLQKDVNNIQVNPVEYYFPGTLLHYAIDLSTLEDIDYVDEFNFDF